MYQMHRRNGGYVPEHDEWLWVTIGADFIACLVILPVFL